MNHLVIRTREAADLCEQLESGGLFVPTDRPLDVGDVVDLVVLLEEQDRRAEIATRVVARRFPSGARSALPAGVQVSPLDVAGIRGQLAPSSVTVNA